MCQAIESSTTPLDGCVFAGSCKWVDMGVIKGSQTTEVREVLKVVCECDG